MIDPVEKRKVGRVRLQTPLQAEVESLRVVVIDISARGLRIEHPFALPVGKEVLLNLIFEQETIPVQCSVVRCRLDKSSTRDAIIYNTGLNFCDPKEATVARVSKMIHDLVNFDIEARKDYARSLA